LFVPFFFFAVEIMAQVLRFGATSTFALIVCFAFTSEINNIGRTQITFWFFWSIKIPQIFFGIEIIAHKKCWILFVSIIQIDITPWVLCLTSDVWNILITIIENPWNIIVHTSAAALCVGTIRAIIIRRMWWHLTIRWSRLTNRHFVFKLNLFN